MLSGGDWTTLSGFGNRRLPRRLGIELVELEDWNCCGATAYMSINEVLSFSLSARNLCQAKKIGDTLVTACSACYTNLRKTEAYLADFPEIKTKVDASLAEAGLRYEGGVATKHFLQTVVEDVGLEKVKSHVKKPLTGLRVAPYYGCQIARPYGIEDDADNPTMMDRLLATLGATPTDYPMKTVCCGGSLMGIQKDVALRLCRNILLCAQQYGAQCVAVTCPLCQMNLDAFQSSINKTYGTRLQSPNRVFHSIDGCCVWIGFEEPGIESMHRPGDELSWPHMH